MVGYTLKSDDAPTSKIGHICHMINLSLNKLHSCLVKMAGFLPRSFMRGFL